MLRDFGRALAQIGDPAFRRVLALGLALSVALLFGVYALFLSFVNWATPDTVDVPWFGEVTWVDDLLTLSSILTMIFLSVFLMIPVASAFTSLFLDDVADAVEARYYPGLPPAPRVPFLVGLKDTLGFFVVLVFANIIALFLYVAIPPAMPVIFLGLNGFLLGREYFQLVALRRLGRAGARAMRRRHSGQIWLAGVLMSVPLTIPLVNLAMPVLGAAAFTHLFHRLQAASSG